MIHRPSSQGVRVSSSLLLLALILPAPTCAASTLSTLTSCQRRIALRGATFALKVIRANLKCATETSECQIECDEGVFGPSCDTSPPPCCDSDDPGSNMSFGACMTNAQAVCAKQTSIIADAETSKQESITSACSDLTDDELCGAQTEGLNFATLNAGCQALNSGYTCNLPNLVQCVGGPLEQQLLGQISATLNPRLSDVVAALNLQIPGVPTSRRVKGTVPANKVDIWQISGQAGDQVIARVKTGDDTGTGTSTLLPGLALLDVSLTPVANTNVVNVQCAVPNACGSQCPLFKRTLPFDGTFYIVVRGLSGGGCTGGKYKLVVISPSGTVPSLVSDDSDPPPGL